ncbi:MAG TPA: CHRD domain-containing protein [Stellaceae bacterium]|nr:CHRD domain-containing protein [Stellaceae bacterium]
MRKTALMLGLLAAAAIWPAAQAAATTYRASLSTASEVPPVQGAGSGSAAINVDTATRKLSWRVEYSGMSSPVVAAHIHCGAAAGANAPVAVPLGKAPNLASPIEGSGKMTAAQLAELKAGKCYVNLHTAKHKPGEARGQLAP